MGNCINTQLLAVSRELNSFPVDTPFKLPAPLPSWPSGGGFANGSIDLGGGLEVRKVSTFRKVWAAQDGGQDGLGATFFNPAPVPEGFCALGSYAQANSRPLFGWVLVGRDTSGGGVASLVKPVDYTLIWSSESSSVKQDGGHGYFWLPVPPDGYKAVGVLVTGSPAKPSPDDVWCVRSDLTEQSENEASIWSAGGFSVSVLRPAARGVEALGVRVGTFIAQADANTPSHASLACLKNTSSDRLSCMPNRSQIDAIMHAYSPWIYFHSDEEYLPSSVRWFFENGALLYQSGKPNPVSIAPDGSNLPQGGSADGAYWIDLPADDGQKDRVKKGDLASAKSYLHVKPMLGATFTDVAIWLFYPFNGAARAKVKVKPINVIKLGRIGEHVGDWEHVTLRVSNFSGELWRVYLSEHSGGTWTDASQLEFHGGNKPVAYSSLHGHAMYPRAGLVLQGSDGVGIRNDADKGSSMDTGATFEVVAAEYLNPSVPEPAWLNYEREWGPKITYNAADELQKVIRLLPGKLKSALQKVVEEMPDEVLGQEGPTGPKAKSDWTMDEK